jgi:signal transduction histidine kinase
LFLFFATRDKSYFFYVIYLATLAIAQFTMAGLAFKYFWPNLPVLNNYSIIWTSALAGIAAVYFSISFLHTSTYLPLVHKSLIAIIVVYVGALAVSFFPANYLSYIILNFNGMIAGLLLIYTSYSIYKRGYRPALYYLLAWSAFLLGMIIFVLRNLRILPSNNFTNYVLYAGSAIEVVLLAIALAEKINILRKEKESSQQEALQISLENEKLVKEQNYLLEQKVAERTEELQLAHGKVSSAFKNLKDAQIQLVEAEKMASLGQLTAGIAHEINNPINFVKSNIKPLQLDLKDVLLVIDEYEKLHQAEIDVIPEQLQKIAALKKKIDLDFVRNEMSDLMKGIENGAERTAEIVRGLRTFSRLDESVIKTVNIHEGVDTTLLLLRSSISENVKIEKHYAAEGSIECFPGKLNQVFMNLLSNAIHAIKTKETLVGNETITISTRDIEDNKIQISIKDSGKGMSKEVLQKIFEPFFTTKDVGEGTGLGLAIVFKIIQEHAGKIDVLSEEGNGTEFTITLNHSIPVKAGKSN